MHINFDDESLIISNIQLFLKENMNPNLCLSGVWDKPSHDALVQYLKLPNTADVYEAKRRIFSEFTYRSSMPPYAFVDGGGIINFDHEMTPESILFFTKPTTTSYENGVMFISKHAEELNEFAQTFGWSITRHTSYGSGSSVSGRTRAEILLEKTGIYNHFPNKEVLPMVNLFDGKYIYNWCFVSSSTFEGMMSQNNNYKIAVIPCKPGDTFTLTHGYSMSCEMAFAYTERTIRELKSGEAISVKGVESRLETSVKGSIAPGDWDYYEVPKNSNARYLLVQMPYREDLTSYSTEEVTILIGDVNLDGIVDSNDLALLKDYVEAIEQNRTPPQELSGNARIAANVTRDLDTDGNPIINRDDLIVLEKSIREGRVLDLGSVTFQNSSRVSAHELDRLLVMQGKLSENEDLNIPIDQFWIKPWSVHSKFLEYFLGRVIHKYSDIEDICWLQENIRHMFANYSEKFTGKYDDPDTYALNEKIVADEMTGQLKYYKEGIFTGYTVVSEDNLETGSFVDEKGNPAPVHIYKRRLYEGNTYLKRVVLADGSIASYDSENSLKSLVKKFQLFTNEQLKYSGVSASDRIKWTTGNYCVDTDAHFVKSINSGITYTVGAFR